MLVRQSLGWEGWRQPAASCGQLLLQQMVTQLLLFTLLNVPIQNTGVPYDCHLRKLTTQRYTWVRLLLPTKQVWQSMKIERNACFFCGH